MVYSVPSSTVSCLVISSEVLVRSGGGSGGGGSEVWIDGSPFIYCGTVTTGCQMPNTMWWYQHPEICPVYCPCWGIP